MQIKPIAEQALRSNQTVVPQRLIAALGVQTEFAVQHPTMEEYEQLGAHLYAIDAVLGEFAEEHGYAVYNHYPAGGIRIVASLRGRS